MEYGIPAEFRKNSVSTEYGIRQNSVKIPYRRNTEFCILGNSVKKRIPYSAEFRKNAEFCMLRNSILNAEFCIFAEFRKKYGIPHVREFRGIWNSTC